MKKLFLSLISICILIAVGLTYSNHKTLNQYSLLIGDIEALTTIETDEPHWNPDWVNNPKNDLDRKPMAVDCSYGIGGC